MGLFSSWSLSPLASASGNAPGVSWAGVGGAEVPFVIGASSSRSMGVELRASSRAMAADSRLSSSAGRLRG